MDLAMDVYIPEDYVRSRYKYKSSMSMQKRDGLVSFKDNETADEKKFQLQGDKNTMISSSISDSCISSFKEHILFNYFTP